MHQPWREFPWSVAFWAAYALAFSLEARRLLPRRGEGAEPERAVRDRGSCFAIAGLMFVALALAFWYADSERALDFGWHRHAWFVAGLVAMLAGALVRQWAMSALGTQFTGMVTIGEEHRLVNTGPYRYARHPAYTGAFLMWGGLGLALTNGVSLLVLALAAALAYGLRVRVEEAALHAALGERYADYCRRTRRFVPGLF